MIPALIAAAAAVAGNVYSSVKTARANAERKNAQLKALDKASTRNENTFNYLMGSPRYAAQKELQQLGDIIRDRKAARTGAKKVVGGTQASVQAGDAQDVAMLNQTTQSGIAQGLDQRKEYVQNYTQNQNNLDMQKAAVEADYQQAVAQNNAAAAKGLSQAAGQVATAFDGSASSSDSAKTVGNTNGGTVATSPTGTKTTTSQNVTSVNETPTHEVTGHLSTGVTSQQPKTFNEMVNAQEAKTRKPAASVSRKTSNNSGNSLYEGILPRYVMRKGL